jgi:hypothetical protein
VRYLQITPNQCNGKSISCYKTIVSVNEPISAWPDIKLKSLFKNVISVIDPSYKLNINNGFNLDMKILRQSSDEFSFWDPGFDISYRNEPRNVNC